MTLKLMYDNVVVAIRIGEEGNFKMKLQVGIPEFFIPRDLFFGSKKEIPFIDFLGWIEQRIFPKERIGAKNLLKELGLDEYRPFAIAKQTKACLMEDGWWVAFSDDDEFQKDTIRGAAGFPEWEFRDGRWTQDKNPPHEML